MSLINAMKYIDIEIFIQKGPVEVVINMLKHNVYHSLKNGISDLETNNLDSKN